MAAVVDIIGRCGLNVDVCHRNQHDKSKLALYKPLIHNCNHLKQLYVRNNAITFSYRGGCGLCGCRPHINEFKRSVGLGYR